MTPNADRGFDVWIFVCVCDIQNLSSKEQDFPLTAVIINSTRVIAYELPQRQLSPWDAIGADRFSYRVFVYVR
jgi:hypothetical protein